MIEKKDKIRKINFNKIGCKVPLCNRWKLCNRNKKKTCVLRSMFLENIQRHKRKLQELVNNEKISSKELIKWKQENIYYWKVKK